MKSSVLVKLILVSLLASGIIVLLGTKAMVSANPLYYRLAPNPVLMILSRFDQLNPWAPSNLLVQPRLTSTPSISSTVKSAGLTPLITPVIMVVPTPVLVPMREDNKDSMEKSKNHLLKEDREDQTSHCTPLPHTYYYTFINKPFPLLENKLTIPLPKICDLEMVADGSWHL